MNDNSISPTGKAPNPNRRRAKLILLWVAIAVYLGWLQSGPSHEAITGLIFAMIALID
jgi:hypothetical protein